MNWGVVSARVYQAPSDGLQFSVPHEWPTSLTLQEVNICMNTSFTSFSISVNVNLLLRHLTYSLSCAMSSIVSLVHNVQLEVLLSHHHYHFLYTPLLACLFFKFSDSPSTSQKQQEKGPTRCHPPLVAAHCQPLQMLLLTIWEVYGRILNHTCTLNAYHDIYIY